MMTGPVHCKMWRWAAVLACAATLMACAVPEWQKPGTPAPQIARDMGQPQVRVGLPEGGERWIYSYQPAGQQVYHMVFDAQQQLLRVEQVLQEAYFQRLRRTAVRTCTTTLASPRWSSMSPTSKATSGPTGFAKIASTVRRMSLSIRRALCSA